MQEIQQHIAGQHTLPSLSGMLAQQRQEDIGRAVEHDRMVSIALANSSGTVSSRSRRPLLSALGGLKALAAALARAMDAHSAYADARARTAPAGPNSSLVCCA